MDLNDLYSRHQVSVMRADAALCPDAALEHTDLAAGYAREIQRRRTASGAGLIPSTIG